LCLAAAKKLGCGTGELVTDQIMTGTKNPILLFIWEVLRLIIVKQIKVTENPGAFRLLEGTENVEDLEKVNKETILFRWVNHQLKSNENERHVSNLANDLKDGEVYTIILSQISPGECMFIISYFFFFFIFSFLSVLFSFLFLFLFLFRFIFCLIFYFFFFFNYLFIFVIFLGLGRRFEWTERESSIETSSDSYQ
jgi:hypothetical protein